MAQADKSEDRNDGAVRSGTALPWKVGNGSNTNDQTVFTGGPAGDEDISAGPLSSTLLIALISLGVLFICFFGSCGLCMATKPWAYKAYDTTPGEPLSLKTWCCRKFIWSSPK